jgi:putative intracellular protease/amidase
LTKSQVEPNTKQSAPSSSVHNAHTDGNLVTAPAWPAHLAWMRQFLTVLGTKIDM